MPSAPPAPPAPEITVTEPRFWRKKIALILLMLGAAVLCSAVVLFSRFWPFDQRSVMQDLQEASDSQVRVQTFHTSFFPSPGCTLENVVFFHGSAAKPLVTIERLTIQGSYLGILARRVSRVTAQGMRIVIPPFRLERYSPTARLSSSYRVTLRINPFVSTFIRLLCAMSGGLGLSPTTS